ncbi:hypothetical protein [Pyrobaculum aerophilum]|uniref:hypothetical protein n=1 Tax=Pyrobaculum aerophilum TaxID=13773 RepID=UPI002FD9CED0
MSILKRKNEKKEEDELEKILSQIKTEEEEEEGNAAVVTIQIAGLKELVKAIEKLTEALKKCEES